MKKLFFTIFLIIFLSTSIVYAQEGSLKWTYTTGGSHIQSSPAIGSDGTIYVGSNDGNLYAIDSLGHLKWAYQTGGGGVSYYGILSSPAIGSDGTIYVGSNYNGQLYAINPSGTLKWSYTTGAGSAHTIKTSPAIGSDGTIYVGDDKLYAINPSGTLKWSYTTGVISDSSWLPPSPAIGSDGTIYVGSNYNGQLYAINPSGTLKWSYTTGSNVNTNLQSSPAIGSDGTIYVGGDKLYAINPSGTLKWTYQTISYIQSSPAIGSDGTIYVACGDSKLYAINPSGTLKWFDKLGFTTYVDNLHSSPAIGSDGIIYVGDDKLYAINPSGTLKWTYTTGGSLIQSSPTIDIDGTIYVGSGDGKLYAINSGSPSLASSSWPMFHHDEKHTGLYYISPTTTTIPITSSPIIIYDSEDAYVNDKNPNNNYGSDRIVVRNQLIGAFEDVANGWVKFDLSSFSGIHITSAILRMSMYSASPGTNVYVHVSPTDSWNEHRITWNNQPSYGGIIIGGTGNWDVTDLVKQEYNGNKKISLVLTHVASDQSGAIFDSKEVNNWAYGHQPYLEISFETTTTPPQPTTSIRRGGGGGGRGRAIPLGTTEGLNDPLVILVALIAVVVIIYGAFKFFAKKR
jgi:outer membrane protein assembly factor BamB